MKYDIGLISSSVNLPAFDIYAAALECSVKAGERVAQYEFCEVHAHVCIVSIQSLLAPFPFTRSALPQYPPPNAKRIVHVSCGFIVSRSLPE